MADRNNPYLGQCLCATVRFKITAAINDIIMCHCSLCRKAQGSAFACNANVASQDFHFISGENNLSYYEATPGQVKYFCKTCGSPIMSRQPDKPDITRIRLGTLETDIVERVSAHIFVGSKANWENINDDLPQFNEYDSSRE